LPIMVASPRWLHESLLPYMRHLMW
jgi:hypothetical protein